MIGKRNQKVPGREIRRLHTTLTIRLIQSLTIILTPGLSTCLTQTQPLPFALVLPLAKHLAYLLPYLLGLPNPP
uniref:Uncharacterized protein n=1 Tax=candidate division WOR-3 bacterium TaxID=2052148 RepID=A0A7C6A9P3_UNCW3